MTALTDLSDVINRATGGNSGSPEFEFLFKDARIGSSAASAPIAGRWMSLWQNNGLPSGVSTSPSTGIPTRTTTGAIPITNAATGCQKWLLGMTAFSALAGSLMLYDRLLHTSGLNATLTTAQSVSQSVGRYNTGTTCVGNVIFLEIYTQIGATSTTASVTYVNQSGSTVTTPTITFGGTNNREAQRLLPVPLASGDTGVQSITSVALAATTGTAGDFGVTVARPLVFCPLAAVGSVRDLVAGLPGPVEVLPDACLALAVFATTATASQIHGSLHFVEK